MFIKGTCFSLFFLFSIFIMEHIFTFVGAVDSCNAYTAVSVLPGYPILIHQGISRQMRRKHSSMHVLQEAVSTQSEEKERDVRRVNKLTACVTGEKSVTRAALFC